MTEKSCAKCFYAHANCGDSSIACDSEEAVCDTYLGIERIENSVINRVLRIIEEKETAYKNVKFKKAKDYFDLGWVSCAKEIRWA